MSTVDDQDRLFTSTRGRIVLVLRHGPMTVNEIASSLTLTDNANCAHLTALQRDELVVQGDPRRGFPKPAYVCEFGLAAEHFFPNAYDAILRELVDAFKDNIPPDVLRHFRREVGHRGASEHLPVAGDFRERLELAARVIGELGGLAMIVTTDTGCEIRCASCSLAAMVERNPNGCILAEARLSDLVGHDACSVCDHDPQSRCRFRPTYLSSTAGSSSS